MRRIRIFFIICLMGILLGMLVRYNGTIIYNQNEEFTQALDERDSKKMYTLLDNANKVEKQVYRKSVEQEIIDLHHSCEKDEISTLQLIDEFRFIISTIGNSDLFVDDEDKNNLILQMNFDKLMDFVLLEDAKAIDEHVLYNIVDNDFKRQEGDCLDYEGSHKEYENMVALNKCWQKVQQFSSTFNATTKGSEIAQRFEKVKEAKKTYYSLIRKMEESETIDLCKQFLTISSDEKDQVLAYKKTEAVRHIARFGIKKCETGTQINDLIAALKKDCNLSDGEIKEIKENIVAASVECMENMALDDSEGMKAVKATFILDLDEGQRERVCTYFAELLKTMHVDGNLESLKMICSNLYTSNVDLYNAVKTKLMLDVGDRNVKDYFAYLMQLQTCFPEDVALQQDIQGRMAQVLTETETVFEEMYSAGDVVALFQLIGEMEVTFSGNPDYTTRLEEIKVGYLDKVKADFEIAVQSYDANIYVEKQSVVNELMLMFPEDPDLSKYLDKFNTETWKNAYATILDSMTKEDKGAILSVDGRDYPIVVLYQEGMLKFMYFSNNKVEMIKEVKAFFYNPSHNAQGWKSGYLFQKGDEFLVNTKQVGYTAENGEINSYQLTIFTLDSATEDVWYRITHSGRTDFSLLFGEYDIASKTVFNRTDVLEDGDDSTLRNTHTNFFNSGKTIDMLEAGVLKKVLQEK